MNTEMKDALVKVPQVTLGFWVVKILATTLGETGGDAVSMSMDLGYLIGTVVFMAFFILGVMFQIRSKKFNPYITAIIGLIGPLLAIFDREGPSILGEELFTFLIIFGFVLLAWSLTKIIQLKNIKLNELWLFITSSFIFFFRY